jgi:hypothetical protein
MKKTLFFMALATAMLTSTSCSNASKEDVAGQHNIQVTKVSNYLYETTLDYDYDIDEGKELIEKNEPVMGGCTSISIGNRRARNFDWLFSNGIVVMVRSTKTENRHASIAVSPLVKLDEDIAKDGKYHEQYELLPYISVDGTNDAGISINTNVVNRDELGHWEMKTEATDDDLTELLIPRLILDNCSNLSEIIPLLEKYDWISMPKLETHMMVTGPRSSDDATVTTVVLEFVPFTEGGKTYRRLCCISQDEKDIAIVGGDAARFWHSKADIFIMTNFHLWHFEADKDRKGRLLSATANPMGFERYETIEEAAQSAIAIIGGKDKVTSQQMEDIIHSVHYTRNYDLNSSDFWYTETAEVYPGREALINATPLQRSPHGDINNLIPGKDNAFINLVKNELATRAKRDRKVKNNFWESVHTTIYNYEERTIKIAVHEGSDYREYKL